MKIILFYILRKFFVKLEIKDNLIRVIILDISGVYAQIHNQGYFDKLSIDDIKQQYSDTERWRVVVLDE